MLTLKNIYKKNYYISPIYPSTKNESFQKFRSQYFHGHPPHAKNLMSQPEKLVLGSNRYVQIHRTLFREECLMKKDMTDEKMKYCLPSTGLINTWPSVSTLGSFVQNNNVSLVPKLIATSLSLNLIPMRDAGLSPVNATTSQSLAKLYLLIIYCDIVPITLLVGTGSFNRSLR